MKIGQIVNKMPIQKLAKSSPKLYDCSTLIGIEIEVENYVKGLDRTKVEAGYWIDKEDNSLRNSGRELVFAEPLFGADVITALEFACTQAIKNKWAISERTGIHVHVDMRNVEIEQFRNFCCINALLEPCLYNWIGNRRGENHFCLPWYSADIDLEKIAEFLPKAEKNPGITRELLKSVRKYSGLNLQALVNFGTCEYRHMKTTFYDVHIIDWLNIILRMRDFAIKWTKGPDALCRLGKYNGPKGFLLQVFDHDLGSQLWYDGFNEDYVGKGMVTAELFLETKAELWEKNNPNKNIFDYVLAKKLKEPASSLTEKEHPGVAAFKRQSKAIKRDTKFKKPVVVVGHLDLDFTPIDNVALNNLYNNNVHAQPPIPLNWLDDPPEILPAPEGNN